MEAERETRAERPGSCLPRRWCNNKRRKRGSPPPLPPGLLRRHPDGTFFPLMLASSANVRSPRARQILKHLLRLHLTFVRGGGGSAISPPSLDRVLPPGLHSLLPLLLSSTNDLDMTVLAAEMLGAIALCSLDANEEVASDGETVGALVAALGSSSKKVATAACQAVLDLSIAPPGRERLRESSAVEKLLSQLRLLHQFVLAVHKKKATAAS